MGVHVKRCVNNMDVSTRKRLFCPQCNSYVAKSVYYSHKQLHFDHSRKEWKQKYRKGLRTTSSSRVNDSLVSFEFCPNDSESSYMQTTYDNSGELITAHQ